MFARVARWEGADADAMRESAAAINAQATDGPPEGLPAKAFLMLIDPDSGTSLGVTLFETKADLEQGSRTLEGMSPPNNGLGRRTSVESFEVAVDLRAI